MKVFTFYQVFSTFLSLPSTPVFVLYLVMIWGSKFYQKYTKPLSLRPILILHNVTCSVISLYTAAGMLYGILESKSVFLKASSSTLYHFFYVYWITKNIELLDTVFMILRHRRRQISFLHVFHHSSMLLLTDFCHRYTPWPAIAFVVGLNSVVHVVLYAYYAQTAYDPSRAPAWKRNMTQMQIIQFLLGLVHHTFGYIYHGFCIYGFLYGVGMLYMFSSFYYHAFINKKSFTTYHYKREVTSTRNIKYD
ncbi:very long chain fatty acid elongase 5-like [Saccoglossus kowalevskii]|uniref:Elongation of very long chain fatty acids protein n=1 Tax=Saccoglossus kowalevskii TaxID=10224 RepID=A0ABM0GRZ8_SACKO|nr:PREDICTED: elongation of very long chain fatty acids protein 5-like [Saccoglossus kowalevskii]